MATRPDSITPFIAQLLAPLPGGAEQADTKDFRRLIERDMLMVWAEGMEHVDLARANHQQAALRARIAGDMLATDYFYLHNHLLKAERRQCLIPAPTAKELRWKKKRDPEVVDDPAVARAIKADEARLGVN